MKPILKLLGLTVIPALIGAFFRSQVTASGSSVAFILMVLGGGLILPMIAETVIKSRSAKTKAANGIRVSKASGYSFIAGLVFFSAGFGYALAA